MSGGAGLQSGLPVPALESGVHPSPASLLHSPFHSEKGLICAIHYLVHYLWGGRVWMQSHQVLFLVAARAWRETRIERR